MGELARVVFEIHGTGSTEVTGIVVDTASKGKDRVGAPNRAIVAGRGVIVITEGRRLSLDHATRRRTSSNNMATKTGSAWGSRVDRRLEDDSPTCDGGNLRGDINADCLFTVGDLVMLKRFKVGRKIDYKYEAFQKKQMDPDLNGKIDEVDISFILYVLAKKYRFLQALPSPKVDGCEITVDATLLDDQSKLVTNGVTTQVKLEVGTKLNAGNDGLVVQVGKKT